MTNPIKRLRVFAGPNGSGKTTISVDVRRKIPFGVFVNADEIEKSIRENGFVDLVDFEVYGTTSQIRTYMDEYGREDLDATLLNVESNKVSYNGEVTSYLTAMISAFIRDYLLEEGKSFSFETVFSHQSKVEIIRRANKLGYKTYFYFICTKDPQVNVDRVKDRVLKGGHNVPEDKIISRYYRSLKLMKEAVKLSHRAYIWDNTQNKSDLIIEVTEGKKVTPHNDSIPQWVSENLFTNKTES